MAGKYPLFVHTVRQEYPGKKVELWVQDEVRIGQQGMLTNVWAPKGSRPTAVKQTEYEWVYIKSHYLSNRIYKDYNDLFETVKEAWNKISSEKFCSICNTKWILREN